MRLNLLIFFVVLVLASCNKGDKNLNTAPDTFIALESINLSGDNRLNSIVNLNWAGTDKDGFVKGYEISFDNSTWTFTENQDSTFRFSISAGSDSVDVTIYIRSVDNEDLVDESPSQLRIPLKNTAPIVKFTSNLMPYDSVNSVISLPWSASDSDGDNTIDSIYIKINDAAWYPVKKTARFLSIVPVNPEATGSTNSYIYYSHNDPQSALIQGLKIGEKNRIYIKVIDIANAPSLIDSSNEIFVRRKTADLLVIGANSTNPKSFYVNLLNTVYPTFDFVNYSINSGANQPKYWNPTFSLILAMYDKVLMYFDDLPYTETLTGQSKILLESMSVPLQGYLNSGGKAFVSAKFQPTLSKTSSVFQTLPMDSLSSSASQPYMTTDSLAVPTTSDYPVLKPSQFILGIDPFYPTADAEVIYKAQLTAAASWYGPKNIGAIRKYQGKTNVVFFSLELNKLNGQPAEMQTLFDKILNNEFNW